MTKPPASPETMTEATSIDSTRSWRDGLRMAVKLFVVGVLAYLIFQRVDFGEVVAALARISPSSFIAAFVLQCLTLFLSALRWHLCLIIADLRTRPAATVRIFFSTNFIGTALPTGIGQDVLRVYSVAKLGGLDAARLAKATASVVLDRIAGLTAFGLLAFPALIAISHRSSAAASQCAVPVAWLTPTQVALIAGAVAAAGGCLVAVLMVRHQRSGWMMQQAWERVSRQLGRLSTVAGLSVSIVIMVVLVVYALGVEITPATPSAEYFLTIPLIALLAQLPLSILGLGVREAGFVFLFACDSAGREDVLALSIAYFSVGLLANLLGGLAFLAPSGEAGRTRA